MATTMNFFRAQDEARGRTTKLVVLLVLSVLILAGGLYAVAVYGKAKLFTGGRLDWVQPKLFLATAGSALAVIAIGSLVRISELAKGGAFVAQSLGGRLVAPHTADPRERRFLNVVEEMALASGLPMPACYVVDTDRTINAFAAGNDVHDAAIAVTRGALEHLTRDELQGVVAHEFSHIGNGDMKLNIRIVGTIAGLTALSQLGYILMRLMGEATDDKDAAKVTIPLAFVGLIVFILGLGGAFCAKVIQASVSRQREYLADASAAQFTRNPVGLASALKKVAGLAGGKRTAHAADLELQHLYFSSTGGFIEFLFSSHPPVRERIRRLDPAFDGIIPDVQPVGVIDDAPGPSRLATPVAVPPPMPVAGGVRIPTSLEIQNAVGFRGALPMDLRAAAADPIGAMALVIGLTLRVDPAMRAQQLAAAKALAGGEVAAEVSRLEPQLRALPAGSRVPLLDLAMPGLRQLSPSQLGLFRLAIQKVGYDADDGLLVLLVQASMKRYLGDTPRTTPPPMVDLAEAYALVLSAVVHTSSETPEAQQRAYGLGVAEMAWKAIPAHVLTTAEVDLQKVDEALAVIAAQAVADRRKFVRACGVAMLHDAVAEPAEIEILRAVADTVGITFAKGS